MSLDEGNHKYVLSFDEFNISVITHTQQRVEIAYKNFLICLTLSTFPYI